ALRDLGQDLLEQEPRVLIAQFVILEAAIARRFTAGLCRRDFARVDEDANRDWHLSLVNQIVEDDRYSKLTILVDVVLTVLEDHDVGRLVGRVLSRHIEPVLTLSPRENLARPLVIGNGSFGDILLSRAVGAERVIVCGICEIDRKSDQQESKQTA